MTDDSKDPQVNVRLYDLDRINQMRRKAGRTQITRRDAEGVVRDHRGNSDALTEALLNYQIPPNTKEHHSIKEQPE